MSKNLEELLSKRSADRAVVDAHKLRMLEEILAHRLRELRESADLTQVQVADLMQVSQNRVSRIENGDIERTQIDTLRKYAEALGGQLRVEIDLGDQQLRIA